MSLPPADDYLFVIEPCARDRLSSLLQQTDGSRSRILVSDETRAGLQHDASAGPFPDHDADTWQRLKPRLLEALGQSRVGCRLVVIGSEAFLWDVHGVAIDSGMVDQEILLYPIEQRGRRVFCAHCRTLTEAVQVSPVACSGCGMNLEVRDHFSRRLGAYMGVRIDAEEPGVIPPQEELD